MVRCKSCGIECQDTSLKPCINCGKCKFGTDNSYCLCEVCSSSNEKKDKELSTDEYWEKHHPKPKVKK